MDYPVRCQIIDVTGMEVMPGVLGRTPEVSQPHVGERGLAEDTADGNVRITLDGGGVLMGYECWWVPLEDKAMNTNMQTDRDDTERWSLRCSCGDEAWNCASDLAARFRKVHDYHVVTETEHFWLPEDLRVRETPR